MKIQNGMVPLSVHCFANFASTVQVQVLPSQSTTGSTCTGTSTSACSCMFFLYKHKTQHNAAIQTMLQDSVLILSQFQLRYSIQNPKHPHVAMFTLYKQYYWETIKTKTTKKSFLLRYQIVLATQYKVLQRLFSESSINFVRWSYCYRE